MTHRDALSAVWPGLQLKFQDSGCTVTNWESRRETGCPTTHYNRTYAPRQTTKTLRPPTPGGRSAGQFGPAREIYFTSTVAPASVNFLAMVAASSLLTPSLIGLGAPSTRSLASFKPRLVTSRTALMTLILLAPAPVRTTVNSVFSSTPGPAPAPPPAAATAAAAAAETPSFSSSSLTS